MQVLLSLCRRLSASQGQKYLLENCHIAFYPITACENCPNDFCSCENYEENEDYISCVDHYDLIYRNCMYNCDHNDNLCYSACNREFDENIENCPCKPNCPNGCPCPNYECPETTTDVTTTTLTTTPSTTTSVEQSNNTVLVLSTYSGVKPGQGLKTVEYLNGLCINFEQLCKLQTSFV